jgi:hypothetical protein
VLHAVDRNADDFNLDLWATAAVVWTQVLAGDELKHNMKLVKYFFRVLGTVATLVIKNVNS